MPAPPPPPPALAPYNNQGRTDYVATPTRSNELPPPPSAEPAPSAESVQHAAAPSEEHSQSYAEIFALTQDGELHSGAPVMTSSGPGTTIAIGSVLFALGVTMLQVRRRLRLM